MAKNELQSLAGNGAVREYLNLLAGSRPEAGMEYAALIVQLDGMQRQLDAALKELTQVRGELAKMQECPEKGFLSRAMDAAGKGLHAMQWGLAEVKGRIVSGAREAVESVRKSGIKALDKAVSAAGIRKGLEEMHGNLSGSIEDVKKSIEKVETVGRELRSVGEHLKKAGRAVMGREQQKVDGGTEGRFQAAILAPMRREKRILDRMNNLVLAALGSVERLEREAEKARGDKREDMGDSDSPGKAGNGNKREPDKSSRTEGATRDGRLHEGEVARSGGVKEPDERQTVRPDKAKGPDERQTVRLDKAKEPDRRQMVHSDEAKEPDGRQPVRSGEAKEPNRGEPNRYGGVMEPSRGEVSRSGGMKVSDRGEPSRSGGAMEPYRRQTVRASEAKESVRAGNAPTKPSVLKDIQETKRETAVRSVPAAGRHVRAQEAAI